LLIAIFGGLILIFRQKKVLFVMAGIWLFNFFSFFSVCRGFHDFVRLYPVYFPPASVVFTICPSSPMHLQIFSVHQKLALILAVM
jgi:hypothetical protein